MNRAGQKISSKYTLGEKIGQGGFGVVYACMNSETGETVAVKSIKLRNLSKDSLWIIEEEVSLLKKLDHPNIVKYIDTVKTKDDLHIVLEYMENGSLARNLRLFGALSQALCALYTRQVLHGLAYLHDQGVIHRDIKGANILTTKQGLVKLADFGVATHTSAQTNDVVGTPYWMAPEIIELSGPNTACDIWSVGCTIIELLTLKPPYYDIPPMAALYRIVEDEHPPLPEGLSPALRDFLLLCFKKTPNLRHSAKQLLKHRWIARTRGVEEPQFVRADGAFSPEEDDGGTDTIHSAFESSKESKRKSLTRDRNDPLYKIKQPSSSSLEDDDPALSSRRVSEKDRKEWRNSVINTIKRSEEQVQKDLQTARENESKDVDLSEFEMDETDENWDEWEKPDLRKALNRSQKGRFGKVGDDEEDDEDDDEDDEDYDDENDGTGKEIRAAFRAMVGSRGSMGPAVQSQPRLSVDVDDLDGAFGEDDPEPSIFNKEHTPHLDNTNLDSKLAKFRESNEEDDFDDIGIGSLSESTDRRSGASNAADSDVIDALRKRLSINLPNTSDRQQQEADTDPFLDDQFEQDNDDEGDFVEDAGRILVAQQSEQVEKLIGLLRPDQDDETVLSACDKLEHLFREQPAQRRTLLTHHGVIPIMDMLEMSNTKVLHAVLKVVGQIIENDREFQELLSLAGLVPIVAKFCRPTVSRPIRLQAASLVKQFLKTSGVTLQMFVACGGLPILAGLLIPCTTEDETTEKARLKAAFGLSQQVPDIALACVAVDGIQRVFELSSLSAGRGAIPKNDFCRLFAKEGVLRQLVALLEHCRSPKGESECAKLGFEASALIMEISEILLVFSHGDSVVKNQFADTIVLEGILRTLTLEAPFFRAGSHVDSSQKEKHVVGRSGKIALGEEEIGPLIKTLLKCIKNLSMEPSVLEALEASGAIPTLVPFLSYCSSMAKLARMQADGSDENGMFAKLVQGARRIKRHNSFVPGRQLTASQEQLVKEIQNLVMLAMFYLCRLSRSRQEQAAISGIIPLLMDAVATRSPVKTFALQILTDFAHTSDLTRDQLWRCQALDFYLELLVSGDVFWQEKAFISLGAWLAHASPEVERAMLRPRSLQCLVSLFQSAQGSIFENYVKELLMMMTRSHKLSESLGRSGLFMAELVARLSFPKAEVRINLLKMLKLVGEHHEDLEHLVLEHNLYAIVSKIAKQAKESHRVLVMEIASQLLDEWKAALLTDLSK